ncbi:hypothetical protein SLA2020_187150 [Shorea laevis]
MKHRKLFSSSAETNLTTDCPVLCDDYYLSPPPPQPPPSSKSSTHISLYAIVIVSFVSGIFLLVSYFVIIAKSCRSRNNRQRGAEHGTDGEFIDENRFDHPYWFITTVGLQQSVINSISVCKYKKGEGLIEGTECSVCLNEFQEDEMLRLLPKCNHAFHISCIDTWLRSHTNCPVCRAGIVFNGIRNAPMPSRELNSGDMDGITGARIGNSEIEDELDPGRENQEGISDVSENRGGTRDGGHVSKDKQVIIRRSVSMDSCASASLCLAWENLHPVESEGVSSKDDRRSNSGEKTLGNSSSFSQFLHLSPVRMKRSLSCNGRFLSSKHGLSPSASENEKERLISYPEG